VPSSSDVVRRASRSQGLDRTDATAAAHSVVQMIFTNRAGRNSQQQSGHIKAPARCLSLWVVGLAAALVSGCADPDRERRGEVSGSVTLDGQPVASGDITFVPTGTTAGPTSGGTIVDGKYSIGWKNGPAVGDNQARFSGARKSGRKVKGRQGEEDEWIDVFPKKYHELSPEVRKIEPGKNVLNFELSSKK
jgi:hypothetical protein